MNIGIVGIVVVFAAFIVLLIVNPKLSCFGRRLKSPFYPLFRKHKMTRHGSRAETKAHALEKKDVKTEDYGFKL